MNAVIRLKNNMQKSSRKFSDLLTDDMLKEICEFITGQSEYELHYDDNDYNKGRLLTLEYQDKIAYVTLSGENASEGRNSFVQSLPTAIVTYLNDKKNDDQKSIYYYFINTTGNINTEYLNFIYRLAATVGVVFINSIDKIGVTINPYNSITDLHNARKLTVRSQNNSTYITKNNYGQIEIYGKTYGANKKETTLLCLAISVVATNEVILYQVNEGNLSSLPKPDLAAIERKGNIEIIITNEELERREFEENESLRSPIFTYNLLKLRGEKKCTLCDCKIPEIIEGAHVWPVSEIKKLDLPFVEKISYATDGKNGIWLCRNHHKLLDANIIELGNDGSISVNYSHKDDIISNENYKFITNSLTVSKLDNSLLTSEFLEYRNRRYEAM